MKERNSFIITFKKTIVASKGMFMRNVEYMPSSWKDICIGDMSELGVIAFKMMVTEE